MSERTPGPWRLEIGGPHHGPPYIWAISGQVAGGRPNGEIIAESVRPPRGIEPAEMVANGALMARAPLLEEALRALVERFADSVQGNDVTNDEAGDYGCVVCWSERHWDGPTPTGRWSPRSGEGGFGHEKDCTLEQARAVLHPEEAPRDG